MLSELREHPIFICGHPKSGTTLLRSVLDGHPQCVVYPHETFFFRGFLPAAAKRDTEKRVKLACRYLLQFTELVSDMKADFKDFPPDEREHHAFTQMMLSLKNQIDTYGYRHDGDLLAATILAFGQVYGFLSNETRYWVEKSPYNEFFADQIFEWWPKARCIHITRDPRDIYSSYSRKHEALTSDKFANRWLKSSNAGLNNQLRYGKDRYLLFQYEHLVQNPEDALRILIDFLGINDNDILQTPTMRGVPWVGNSMFADKFSGISSKPTNRWKKELSLLDVQVIEQIVGSQMDSLGYKPELKWSLAAKLHILRGYINQYLSALRKSSRADIYNIE